MLRHFRELYKGPLAPVRGGNEYIAYAFAILRGVEIARQLFAGIIEGGRHVRERGIIEFKHSATLVQNPGAM